MSWGNSQLQAGHFVGKVPESPAETIIFLVSTGAGSLATTGLALGAAMGAAIGADTVAVTVVATGTATVVATLAATGAALPAL